MKTRHCREIFNSDSINADQADNDVALPNALVFTWLATHFGIRGVGQLRIINAPRNRMRCRIERLLREIINKNS